MQYEAIIGLEVHVQLKTRTKIFCGCATEFGAVARRLSEHPPETDFDRGIRDTVAWYSNDNVFRANVGRRSRYSIHFMFANNNVVEGNRFYDNAVGVYFMYTEGGVMKNNLISHATGAAGSVAGRSTVRLTIML